MLPDPVGFPRFLLMVGAPLLGPAPAPATLRSALRSGLAARAALAGSWPAAPAPDTEPIGRDDALEDG